MRERRHNQAGANFFHGPRKVRFQLNAQRRHNVTCGRRGASTTLRVTVSLALVAAAACHGSVPRAPTPAGAGADQACPNAVRWVRELVSPADASIRKVALTADGRAIAIAELRRTVVVRGDGKELTTTSARSDCEALVLALDERGGVLWVRRIGGPKSRVSPRAVVVRADGTLAIAGEYSGAPSIEGGTAGTSVGLPPLPEGGVTDPTAPFVAIFDADGEPLRAMALADKGPGRSASFVAEAGHDLVVAGAFKGTITLGTGERSIPLTSRGEQDIFVALLDEQGAARWAKRVGSSASDYPSALAADGRGKIYLAGTFFTRAIVKSPADQAPGVTFGDGPQTAAPIAGREDAFFAEISRDGQLGFLTTVGGKEGAELGDRDSIVALATTAEGDALVLGDGPLPLRFGATTLPFPTNDSERSSYLLRVAPGGRLVWSAPLGAIEARSLAVLPDGDIAVSAHGEGELSYPAAGKRQTLLAAGELDDVILARHGPDGALRWGARFGGDGAEWGEGVAADRTGGLLLAGRFKQDFVVEREGCESLVLHTVAHDNVNSFLIRIAPGGNPGNEQRETALAALRAKVAGLRGEADAATKAGDRGRACAKYEAIRRLVPDDPQAAVELARCGIGTEKPARIAALAREALALASRHHDVILAAHEAARKSAYALLAELGEAVPLPSQGACDTLPAAPACGASLSACAGSAFTGAGSAVRIGTSPAEVSLEGAGDMLPVMPALGMWAGTNEEQWSFSHHWFQRANAVDVLLSDNDSTCKVVTADACLGLVGVVCTTDAQDGEPEPKTTVDEFYLWPVTERAPKGRR